MNLQEMIVTDAEGKIETAEGKDLTGSCIQGEDIYSFYAIKQKNDPKSKPTPEKMAAKVKIMMPLGGELNGLYRFPRVGEKVVVAVEGTSHYLMGYLPSEETPFADKVDGKESTEPFDKQGQVLRYKKTGDNVENKNTDKGYSEIGFYSETTEWKEKDGKNNAVTDSKTGLPLVDKVKISSTGDIETKAQNYNEVSAKRIALFAGYNDEIDSRKANQYDALKNKEKVGRDAFPVLPLDFSTEDSSFFQGDIQMRAKQRIVLKAGKGIEIVAGRSIIRIDDSGISLISRKTSGAVVNPWDSAITVSSRGGLSMFGTRMNLSSAYGFSLTEMFGGSITSLGGVMRLGARNLKLSTLNKVAYVVKGVTASASFAANTASMSMGIAQNAGANEFSSLVANLPNYAALGAGGIGTFVGVNWKLASSDADSTDTASNMCIMTNLFLTILSFVTLVLDTAFIPNPDKNNGGRDGLTLAVAVVEYGIVLQMFIRLNLACLSWSNKSVFLLDHRGTIYESSYVKKEYAVRKTAAKSPLAGFDGTLITDLWNGFKGQAWWKIVLESLGAAVLIGGAAAGSVFGVSNKFNVDAAARKELEDL